ncbi:MAG: RNA polymerase sigma factor [Cytophagales bacterium]|nr:RNA polymerase sigma factor [Armatimonadota bacterium]
MDLRYWFKRGKSLASYPVSADADMEALLAHQQEECALILAARQGDRSAFEQLIKAHLPAVRRFLQSRVAGQDALEDALQETLLGAWTSVPAFEPRVRFRTWLLRIAANKAADSLRVTIRQDRHEAMMSGDFVSEESENWEQAAERRSLVRQALAILPDQQREVIELYYYSELTLSEIARLTGRPLSTTKYQFYAAHTAAAAALKEESNESNRQGRSSILGEGHSPRAKRFAAASISSVNPIATVARMVSTKTMGKAD